MSLTILCITSHFKGMPLIEELKRQGCRILMIVPEAIKNDPWPMDLIDEKYVMPSLLDIANIQNAVSYLARTEKIDQIIPLDDYEVSTAATLREHLRLPGMGESVTRMFRDKLAMRLRARECGVAVPAFSAVFHHPTLNEFMQRVPGPWLLKPRYEAGSMGIKKCANASEVWRWLNQWGDNQSHYLLEKFVPSDVFHVDTIVWDGKIKFSVVHKYGLPPLTVSHGGGVFTTRSMSPDHPDAQALLAMNARVIESLGMVRGINHIEFLKPNGSDDFLFLEAAARVGGANIADMIEYATGMNPWREWARIELAHLRGEEYELPTMHTGYSGVIQCLAKQEYPDMSAYGDNEVVWRLHKQWHAGLIVSSPSAERVEQLLVQYAPRFMHDFVTWQPPLETGRE